MKILSMSATFGKLEHETLTFTPGLNVIEGPNEWGKSTWCAFLVSMLYGMETRAKSTKTALADKERYLPWSGSPMSGSMDIDWNGRKITLQRKTKGRVPLGDFKAFETDTGIAVPELTAANCGEMLLGVERSVFLRSSFIRHSDLPVGQDEALRRRLNALVTTGDESGDAERLAKALKDLKNRCRYNRTGLLPQAEQQRQALENKLREIENLSAQSDHYSQRLEALEQEAARLENHRQTLAYENAQADARRVTQAQEAANAAQAALAEAQAHCATLPSREDAQAKLVRLERYLENRQQLLLAQQRLPAAPTAPQAPAAFAGMTPEAALAKARRDGDAYRALEGSRPWPMAASALLAVIGTILCFRFLLPGVLLIAAGIGLACFALARNHRRKQDQDAIARHYGVDDPESWVATAARYQNDHLHFQKASRERREELERLGRLLETAETSLQQLTDSADPGLCRENWQNILAQYDRLDRLEQDAYHAQRHAEGLQAMVKPAQPPVFPDELTLSPGETARRITDAQAEMQLLSSRISQNRGRMEALGDSGQLNRELAKVEAKIQKLEDTYAALTVALETLNDATLELQRKFAPKIAAQAQDLLQQLTGGRYRQLLLREDLTLEAAAEQEQTLHDALWRSDGTADQMYLALRLAVAQALTPDAPLVLDDALIRFDDQRLRSALAILQNIAGEKQILLFTCQNRENQTLA